MGLQCRVEQTTQLSKYVDDGRGRKDYTYQRNSPEPAGLANARAYGRAASRLVGFCEQPKFFACRCRLLLGLLRHTYMTNQFARLASLPVATPSAFAAPR